MSRRSIVPFCSLFSVQPLELFAHTIQTLLGRQLLMSSWALLGCSLLQCLNASQILMRFLKIPFTRTCINSILVIRNYDTGMEVKNIPACIPRRRPGGLVFGAPRTTQHIGLSWSCASHHFCHHNSSALLSTFRARIANSTKVLFWHKWGGSTSFQGQGDCRAAGAGNRELSCLELISSGHDFCHESRFLAQFKSSPALFSMGQHCLP